MSTTNPLARIPSELSDQWKAQERRTVEGLIARRAELLEIARSEEYDIEEAGNADEEAERILGELNSEWNVTPEMLFENGQDDSLFGELDGPEGELASPNPNEPGPDPEPDEDAQEPAGNAEDPRLDEMEQLTLPGAAKAGSRLSRKVALEAKFIGKGARLTHEVTDPDAVFRLIAQVRLDHNSESPQRDGSGPSAQTTSVVKTQHFRVLRFEMRDDVNYILDLYEELGAEAQAQVRAALEP